MRLCQAFEQSGHRVFVDQRLNVGTEWANELERQIEASDFLVVLLSAAAVQSEMVAHEIEHAYNYSQQHAGKARLLPVRVNYDAALPYQLSLYLDSLQYAVWASPSDDEPLIRQLLDAVSNFKQLPRNETRESRGARRPLFDIAPRPYADPRFVESLRDPRGGVRLGSKFYVERDGDGRLHRELDKPHATIATIRAPRQTGKTSLLVRGVAQARQPGDAGAPGGQVVFIDLQRADSSRDLHDLDAFLHYVALRIGAQLRLGEAAIRKAWRGGSGTPEKLTSLIEEIVLPRAETRVVLAIDEADMLLRTNFHTNFFSLIRSWYNLGALVEIWENLKIIMAISTEPSLLIRDIHQSPFNVGIEIMLNDFDAAQVGDLNERYGAPLDPRDIAAAMSFLNGHPYLTRKALYTLLTENISWPELAQVAAAQRSPFGDHLRHYSWLLRDKPQLRNALQEVLRSNACADELAFYQLSQAGLLKGDSHTACAFRCGLYAEYFRATL
jgi:hypothetical protein